MNRCDGAPKKSSYFSLLKGHCRWRAMTAGDVISRRLKIESNLQSEAIEVKQFLAPFTASLTRQAMQIFLLIMGSSLLVSASFSLVALQQNGMQRHQHFRMHFSESIKAPKEIVFLRRGCLEHSSRLGNVSGIISFAQPIEMDGVIVMFHNIQEIDTENVRYVILGFMEGRNSWTSVASTGFRWARDGIRLLNASVPAQSEFKIDRRLPWPWIGMYVIRPIILGSCCIVQAVLGYLNAPTFAKTAGLLSCVILTLITAVVSCGYAYIGMWRVAIGPLVNGLAFSGWATALLWSESLVATACVAAGVVSLVGRAAEDCLAFADCARLRDQPPFDAAAVLCAGAVLAAVRRSFLSGAVRRVGAELARLDARWRAHESRDTAALARLDAAVARILSSIPLTTTAAALEHRHTQRVGSDDVSSGSKIIADTSTATAETPTGTPIITGEGVAAAAVRHGGEYAAVRSLDQLYSQSYAVASLLRRRCTQWAAATGGRLHMHGRRRSDHRQHCPESPDSRPSQQLVDAGRGGDVMHGRRMKEEVTVEREEDFNSEGSDDIGEPLRKWVLRGLVKSPSRAIEKALTCYGGDVSRLVDICRARLVFDQVGDLTACLELIGGQSGEGVRVVRVKNMLSPQHDARRTAGFRGVIINLCLEEEAARMLGVDLHVCELQLITAGLCPRESAEEHNNYRMFRLARTFLTEAQLPRVASESCWRDIIPLASDDSAHVTGGLEAIGDIGGNFAGKIPGSLKVRSGDVVGVGAVSKMVCKGNWRGHSSEKSLQPRKSGNHHPPFPPSCEVYLSDPIHTALGACRNIPLPLAPSKIPPSVRGADAIDKGHERADDGGSCGNSSGSSSMTDCDEARDVVREEELEHMSAVREVVYEIFQRSTRGDTLDHSKSCFREALHRSSNGSVGFTSRPMVAMSSKPMFQAAILILSLNAAYQLSLVINTLLYSGGEFNADAVRFTMLAADDPRPLGISSFGLLNNGCRLPAPAPACSAVVNNTVMLRFGRPIRANGYYFVTSLTGPPEADPIHWVVEASADDGGSWSTVGASGSQLRRDGRANFFPGLAYPTPVARGREVVIDGRPPWPWAAKWLLTNAAYLLGFLCCLASSLAGKLEQVPEAFAAMMAVGALSGALAAVGYHNEGAHREAAAAWLQVPQPALMGYGVLFAEERMVLLLHLYGLADLTVRAATDVFIYTFDPHQFLLYTVKSPSTLAFVISLAIQCLRTLAIRHARRVVSSDIERYGAAWRLVLADPAASKELADLALAITEQSVGFRSDLARQFNHQRIPAHAPQGFSELGESEAGSEGRRRARQVSICRTTGSGKAIAGSIDLERPVDSLDQLFVQAACLNPILIEKVQVWAAASRGFLFAASTVASEAQTDPGPVGCTVIPTPVRYVRVAGDQPQSIRWAKIKSSSRAIEKVVRSYKQDVSRLIDICRQAIIFERAADVTACIAAMCADKDVVLVRIKNRMDPACDAALSAGYRDVVINMRIHTPATEDLGIETHVCEVQLILRAIAEIKSDEGHQRYVEFRNLRAE